MVSSPLSHLIALTASTKTSPALQILQIAATGPKGPLAYATVRPANPTVLNALEMKPNKKQ